MTKHHKKPNYHIKPIILSDEAKKGLISSPEAPQDILCSKCGKSIGQDDYLLKLAKKGYKIAHIKGECLK